MFAVQTDESSVEPQTRTSAVQSRSPVHGRRRARDTRRVLRPAVLQRQLVEAPVQADRRSSVVIVQVREPSVVVVGVREPSVAAVRVRVPLIRVVETLVSSAVVVWVLISSVIVVGTLVSSITVVRALISS